MFEVVEAQALKKGDRVLDPGSGAEVEVRLAVCGPLRGIATCSLWLDAPANCRLDVKPERLMRRRVAK